jgi:hypothetical protein
MIDGVHDTNSYVIKYSIDNEVPSVNIVWNLD